MFKISWKKTAIDELANLWTKADSALRKAITAAAPQIDTGLRQT